MSYVQKPRSINRHALYKRTGLPISVDPLIGDMAVDSKGNPQGKIINAWWDNKTELWGVELEPLQGLHAS